MGMLIEKYIGKLGRKLFTIFCWLFSVLIIAVFADMVTGTFSAFDAETLQKLPTAGVNGSAGMVSIMFMVFDRVERVCCGRCLYRCVLCRRH